MNYRELRDLKTLYFSYEEVAEKLGIRRDSARVLCSRYVSAGLLVRVKRDVYVLRERWDHLTENETMQIANIIQVPSYVSLTTALSRYEVTTQVQQGFIESISVKRSFNTKTLDLEFNYTKVSRQYYSDFRRDSGVFIATAEKALVDALYLHSFGKYSIDFSALDASRLDEATLMKILDRYPERSRALWRKYAPA